MGRKQRVQEKAKRYHTGKNLLEECQNDQQETAERNGRACALRIPFSRTEYNTGHHQIDAEEKMKYKGPLPKSGRPYVLMQKISDLILEHKYSSYAILKKLDGQEASWTQELTICEKTLYNGIEAGDMPGVTIGNQSRKGLMKRKKGNGNKRKHSNGEFAARPIGNCPNAVLKCLKSGHEMGGTRSTTPRTVHANTC
ncbi:hypothetical protein [Sphaerochaeta pleomorpha]|uniref:hypothetical protein n=1 Tax=Sphaerochaeta pleomorpha TaxID=1131707 RepID=UPI00030BADB2|nr:hypothetical protein [Sphaerochaeta pleomorpha]